MNLTRKASLNVVASSLDYAARLVVGFVITPLLVAGLGAYGYGLWQILSRLIGYITPASGRPTQALMWTIASEQTSTDYESKRRYVGSALVVWSLFLPLMTIAGGLLAWFAPYWLDVPAELSRIVRLTAVILVADRVATSLVDVPRSVLRGANLGYKRMGLSAILVVLGGGLTALALHLDAGLVGVATAPVVTTLLAGVVFLRVAKVNVSWFGIARPSSDDVRRFFNLSGWFLVWRLVMQLMRASDVVLLGMFASVELVTVYSLTKYLPETLISFVAIGVFGITPGLGGIIGSGQTEKAVRVRNEIMALAWLVATAVGSTILLWNRAFVQLWIGPDYSADRVSMLLIVVMVTQFILIRIDANIIDLKLELRQKVLIGVLSVSISLGIAGVLVAYLELGILGLCSGFIAGRSILSLAYPWLVGRFLDVPLLSQLRSLPRPVLALVLLFGLSSRLSELVTAHSWLSLIPFVGVSLGVMTLLAFGGGLSRDQRKRISKRLVSLLRSNRATDSL